MTGSRPGPIAVQCVAGRDAIERLRPQWLALMQADDEAGLFQSVDMCAAWHVQPAGDGERLLLLLAHHDGVPIGLLPLCERGGGGVLGSGLRTLASASPRVDMLACGDKAAVAWAFARWLQDHSSRWELLALDDLRPGTAQRLGRAFAAPGGCEVDGPHPGGSEAYIDTQDGWPAYLLARGSHFRHRLKPQTRKIERLGPLTLRRFEAAGAADAYEEFLRLESQSWKSRSDHSRLPDRERAAFRWLISAGGTVHPDLLFLDVNDKPVAAMLSLTYGGVYNLFVTYFDDALRAWYPGRRLILEAIQHAYAQPGLREINFVGAYPFARAWAGSVREHAQLRVWSGTLRARLHRWIGGRNKPAGRAVAATEAETEAQHA